MFLTFENLTYLQYRIKALEAENASLKSGIRYQKMEEGQRRQRKYYERKIRRLEKELEQEHLRCKKNDGRMVSCI